MAGSWISGVPDANGMKFKLEIGFDSAPTVALASTTWTDRTVDLRSFEIHIGRATNFDEYQTGTASFVLNNRGRTYDPNHSTGPYYGKLLPRKRIRLSSAYAGSGFSPMYTGYVLGWPQSYNRDTRDATVTVNAVDGFSVLQDAVLTSLYEYEVRKDNPVLWLRLGDIGPRVDSSPSKTGGFDASGGSLADGLLLGSANSTFFAAGNWASVSHFDMPVFPFTIEFWMNTPGDVLTPANIMIPFEIDAWSGGPSSWKYIRVFFNNAGLTCEYTDTASSFYMAAGYGGSSSGYPHHIAVVFSSATSMALYFDGAPVASGNPAFGTPTNLGAAAILLSHPVPGAEGLPPMGATYRSCGGALDELAIYPTALSSARVQTHANAGRLGSPNAPSGLGAGWPTGTIVGQALDMAGWPTADREINTGFETIVTGEPKGRSALDFLKDIERTEQGRFYINTLGQAVFHDRAYTAALTSSATFGDANDFDVEARYSEIAYDYSLTFVRNKITVTSITGNSFTVSDATSLAAYLESGEALDNLLFSTDAAMLAMAYRRLQNFKDPRLRVTQLEVKPRRDPDNLFPRARSLLLGDMVTVLHRPQGVGAPISQNVLIEGITHQADADHNFTTTYYLSPDETSAPDGSYYLMWDDPVRGLWGSSRWA